MPPLRLPMMFIGCFNGAWLSWLTATGPLAFVSLLVLAAGLEVAGAWVIKLLE